VGGGVQEFRSSGDRRQETGEAERKKKKEKEGVVVSAFLCVGPVFF
jgi:hypothetical protein